MRLLIVDTCGVVGSVALVRASEVVAVRTMAERAASAQVIATIDFALAAGGWTASELEAIGVVSGPGSFTGVRVGLAAAKGMCEALDVPIAAVSRLEVLQDVAGGGVVALEAGRGEVFVRSLDGFESLLELGDVGGQVVVCESSLAEKLAGARLVEVNAGSAAAAVERLLAAGGSDAALVDANYVRGEAQMYRKAGADA